MTHLATIHKLKTWPVVFEQIMSGQKTFEVRKNDRFFQRGDTVLLQEYDPTWNHIGLFTRREKFFTVGWCMPGPAFGIEAGYVAFSLLPFGDEQ